MNRYLTKSLQVFSNISAGVNKACEYICIIFTVSMIFCVLLQIISRHLMTLPLGWTEEAARYCMIWAGLLSATLSFHDGYDVLLFRRPRTTRLITDLIVRLMHLAAVLLFLGPVVWFAPGFLERQFLRSSEILEIPSGYVTAIVPLFAFIIIFHSLAMTFRPDIRNGTHEST